MTQRKNLNVAKETWKRLKDRKNQGQSFDGLINELLDKTGEQE